jgi:hypothetical protein
MFENIPTVNYRVEEMYIQYIESTVLLFEKKKVCLRDFTSLGILTVFFPDSSLNTSSSSSGLIIYTVTKKIFYFCQTLKGWVMSLDFRI